MIQSEVDAAEGKTKEDRARNVRRVLDSYFADPEAGPTPGMYADPAAVFG